MSNSLLRVCRLALSTRVHEDTPPKPCHAHRIQLSASQAGYRASCMIELAAIWSRPPLCFRCTHTRTRRRASSKRAISTGMIGCFTDKVGGKEIATKSDFLDRNTARPTNQYAKYTATQPQPLMATQPRSGLPRRAAQGPPVLWRAYTWSAFADSDTKDLVARLSFRNHILHSAFSRLIGSKSFTGPPDVSIQGPSGQYRYLEPPHMFWPPRIF